MYDEFDYEINRPKLRKPALGFGDIGGAGQIIYNLVRFEEYDWDNVKDRDVIIPLCDANHSFILPNEKSPTGKEILTSLYNLAKKINKKSKMADTNTLGFPYMLVSAKL